MCVVKNEEHEYIRRHVVHSDIRHVDRDVVLVGERDADVADALRRIRGGREDGLGYFVKCSLDIWSGKKRQLVRTLAGRVGSQRGRIISGHDIIGPNQYAKGNFGVWIRRQTSQDGFKRV